MEGEFEWEGRLEVCFSQRWGIVGGDGWTQTNSQIVCNDLGYTEPVIGGLNCHYLLECACL